MRSVSTWAVGLVALAAGVILFAVPFVTREREILDSAAQPAPLTSTALIELRRGGQACLDQVTITTHSAQARLRVGTFGRPGQRLRLRLRGSGYEVMRDVPGDYIDNAIVAVDLPPPRRDAEVVACVRNGGRRRIALYASQDRTKSHSTTRIDGAVTGPNFDLAFYTARSQTLMQRLPEALRRMGIFRPGFLGPWLFWPLAVLFVLGVPLGTLWAFAASARDDEAQPPAP